MPFAPAQGQFSKEWVIIVVLGSVKMTRMNNYNNIMIIPSMQII